LSLQPFLPVPRTLSVGGELEANLTTEINQWKTQTISTQLIDKQNKISHYEFDAKKLSTIVINAEASILWFDAGVNKEK
jgi:hypothetical protein